MSENVECPGCDGEGFLTAPYPDGETRRSECFDCEGTGRTSENVETSNG